MFMLKSTTYQDRLRTNTKDNPRVDKLVLSVAQYLNLTTQEPLYPFGFGLSFTQWEYSELQVLKPAAADDAAAAAAAAAVGVCEAVRVSVKLSNTGSVNGSEVVQMYVKNEQPHFPAARWSLAGFERVDLAAGGTQTVVLTLTALARAEVREQDYERAVLPSSYSIFVGGGQPQQKPERTTSNVLMAGLDTTGVETKLTDC
jgi:beta-glucosidase